MFAVRLTPTLLRIAGDFSRAKLDHDLLFTMSDNTHASSKRRSVRISLTDEHKTAGSRQRWWSQTGSNRRPPACKAGALPTELWPRTVAGNAHCFRNSVVGLGRLELPTSRLSSARSNQLSYKPKLLTKVH